ncbi:MAG TPA: hypothetical protein VFF78_03115 [Anaerolineaceae bacterium]|nr:hypothetical protein [Anaerolineaceae bacterium]
MDEPPQFSHWKEAWEWYADQASKHFAQQSEAQLLEQIAAGQYDAYYTIWYTLRQIGSLKTCAPVLLEVLRREVGEDQMLIRYHCAAALFHLMGYPDDPIPDLRARVQWDHHGEEARQAAIMELRSLIGD